MQQNNKQNNKRSTFSLLFYLNTSKKKKSGKCPIVGRISIDGGNTAFSTEMEIYPENWDTQQGKAKMKAQDKAKIMTGTELNDINRQIDSLKTDITRHYKTMLESTGFVTAEALKNAIKGIGINQQTNTLMQEFSLFLEEKRKSIGIRCAEKSYELYCNAFDRLKAFLNDRMGVPDIPFGRVDIAFVEDYAAYLKVDLQLSARTVTAYMKSFRTTVKRAFNRGLLRQDPFSGYAHEKAISRIRYLSNTEIGKLMQVEMKSEGKGKDKKNEIANFTRDMFLFSTFTGLAYVDLKNLRCDNLQRQADGSLWIVLNRQKTGTASHIPLLDIPLMILEKYKNTKFSGKEVGKVFRLQTLSNANLHLKQVAKEVGIESQISWHAARHSFGTTICLTNGVPIETLSQMMGHLSIKTTQIYVHVTRTKLNEDMTRLEELIEGRYELAVNF
jgi:site-specific recombinase XerD